MDPIAVVKAASLYYANVSPLNQLRVALDRGDQHNADFLADPYIQEKLDLYVKGLTRWTGWMDETTFARWVGAAMSRYYEEVDR